MYHLGYLIEKNTIKPDPEKIEVLLNVKELKTAKRSNGFSELRVLLQIHPTVCGPGTTAREVMLSDEFTWGAEQRASFEGLKTTLGDGVLRAFNPADDIELESDASPLPSERYSANEGDQCYTLANTVSCRTQLLSA